MKRLMTLMTLLFVSMATQAAVTAKIDRNSIVLGESVTLEVTVDKMTNAQPDFTTLDAVFHVGSTGTSSSTQIINGETSSKTTWQVLLVPKSLGSHIIPPLEVEGERSQPLRLEVKKPDPNAKAQGDIFIEVIPNKTEAHVQEEIILTVRLLYAINLKNGGLSDPQANGVIVAPINKGASYTTQRDGKSYQVLERKYAIYAEQSGPLELNPIIFEGEVTDNSRRNSYSLFQRGRPVRQVSEMLSLTIKPIPQDFLDKPWVPASSLTLSETWSQGDYKVGEPITRTIHVVATGLSETQLPDIELPSFDGAKIYQDKTDTMTRTDGDRLIATKTIKYAVIPSQVGELHIPAFDLTWFDTQSQSTQVATLKHTVLQIGQAEHAAENTPMPTAQMQTERQPLSTTNATEAITSSDGLPTSIWRPIALIFASLWVITTLFLLRRMRKQREQAGSSSQVPAPQTNPLNPNLRALKEATASRMQQSLLAWWNQEHNQKATNLGQIRDQIEDQTTIDALDALQNALYSASAPVPEVNWYQLAKQGGFALKQKGPAQDQGLPPLYH